MEGIIGATSTKLEQKKISMGISEFPVFLFSALATLAFVRISCTLSNFFLTIGSFAILFLLMWALALRTGRYWVIAVSGILLALNPARLGVMGNYGSLWLYSSFCIFILTEKSVKVLAAANWKISVILVLPALISLLFYAKDNASLLTESFRLLEILSPIVIGPVFFTLTLRNSKEKLLAIIVMMFSVLIFYFAVIWWGVPHYVDEDFSAKTSSGFAMQYFLWGQGINMIRTQTGIILSIICATSFILMIDKIGFLIPYISFIAGLGGIFWGRGRGPIVALVMTIGICILTNLRSAGRYIVSILVVGALLGGALTFSPQAQGVYEKWLSRWHLSAGETLDEGRIGAWMASIEQIEREPFGVGKLTMGGKGFTIGAAHNDYLALSISYGIFGGIAYIFVIVYVSLSLYRAFKKYADPFERAIAGASFAAVCCLAINSLTDHLIVNSARYLLAWLIVAVGWSITDQKCRRIAENYIQ